MASSGTMSNSFARGYKLAIDWAVNSQNVAANTSNVTASIWLGSDPYFNIVSGLQKNVSLTVNGTTYTGTSYVDIPVVNYTYWIKLLEVTVDVPHNSDGSKTCSFSGSLAIQVTLNGTYYGTVSTSGSGVFNTIPRATTPVLSKYTAEYGETIGVTLPRALSAFYHILRYQIDNQSGLIEVDVGTSYDFTVPLAWMNWHPQGATSWGWLYVDTYNGSTLIGTTQTRFNTIVPSSVIPTIASLTATRIDNSVPSAWGVYVQGKSQIKLDISGATGAYESTITGYGINGAGYSGATESLTTGILNSSGDVTFTATVTDSRGRTGSTTTSITVEPYTAPRIAAASFVRCLSDGTPDEDGTYIRALIDYDIASVAGNNTATRKIEWKRSASTTWVNAGSFGDNTPAVIGGGNIHVDYAHDVRVSVTDAFSTATNLGVVPTAFATIDFRKGGKGIAFGKVATQDGFDLAMPLIVQDPAQARSALGLGAAALLGSPIPVANGGTGATSAANARTSLGLTNIPYTTTTANIVSAGVCDVNDAGATVIDGICNIGFDGNKTSAANVDTSTVLWTVASAYRPRDTVEIPVTCRLATDTTPRLRRAVLHTDGTVTLNAGMGTAAFDCTFCGSYSIMDSTY